MNDKQYDLFQRQSEADKRDTVEELENNLRLIIEAPRGRKMKGKQKSKQKLYKESKELYEKMVQCSERFIGRQEEVKQLVENLLVAQKSGDYGLLLGALGFGVGKVVGLGVGGLVGGIVGKIIGKKKAKKAQPGK